MLSLLSCQGQSSVNMKAARLLGLLLLVTLALGHGADDRKVTCSLLKYLFYSVTLRRDITVSYLQENYSFFNKINLFLAIISHKKFVLWLTNVFLDQQHYVVYMGQHSHPSSQSVISANHEMLTLVLERQAHIHSFIILLDHLSHGYRIRIHKTKTWFL